ncbi:MAG: PQQ-dependent sugar dehydrogenase [Methylococcales bacterium]
MVITTISMNKLQQYRFAKYMKLCLLSLWLTLLGSGTLAFALPAQFQEQLVISGMNYPTSMAQMPDGRMLVTEKTGQIWILNPTLAIPELASYLEITDINTEGERGLLDIVLDPDFSNNHYVYVSYHRSSDKRIFISRFTDQGNTANLATEFVVWKDPQLFIDAQQFHHGGGLSFGPDDHLYLATGYHNNTNSAQDLTNARGKIIRVARDGSIPSDNPFVDGVGGNLDEIWAYGLRNPWRARWDLQGVGSNGPRLFIGEVGNNSNNTSNEDIHIGRKGANYGWSVCEGNNDCNTSHPQYDPNQVYDAPLFTYEHGGGEAAVMGGIVYHGSQYPAPFSDAYFYGDYPTQVLRYLTFDSNGAVATANDFHDSAGLVVDIKEGLDGALYYIQIASDFDNFATNSGALRRIRFNKANQAPEITTASENITVGESPLMVEFTGVATDPENDLLTYVWLFGDGEQAIGANVNHTYTQEGSYQARLQVTDADNVTTLDPPITITVGSKPQVTINEPIDASKFFAGETINYVASATDADGVLIESSYKWTINLAHNEHIHPETGPITGSSGSFVAPDSNHSYFDDTGFLLTVEVTDSDGISTIKSVRIEPEEVDITFNSQPSGIDIFIDDETLTTPFMYDAAIGFNSSVIAPPAVCISNIEYSFASWSNGAASSFSYLVPNQNATLTAIYTAGGGCDSDEPSPVVCGQALRLDGVNDWVNTGDIGLTNDFTVEAWVKLAPGIDNNDSIFGQGGKGPDINFFDAKLRLFSGSDRIVANTAIVVDSWTHIAITRSGTSLTLYINGIEDATGEFDDILNIRALGRGNQGFLEGELDEVRVWRDVVRTDAQIFQNYKKSVAIDSPGLVGYWTFNESGQVVTDSSAPGNHMGSLGTDTGVSSDDPARITSTAPVIDDCANGDASCTLDTDGNGNIDALSDGLLFTRHLFGLRGDSLIDGALGDACTRCTASDIEIYMDQCIASGAADVDGTGEADALSDGLLGIRYRFGIRGQSLIENSVGEGCSRCTAVEIEDYLQGLNP